MNYPRVVKKSGFGIPQRLIYNCEHVWVKSSKQLTNNEKITWNIPHHVFIEKCKTCEKSRWSKNTTKQRLKAPLNRGIV